MSYLHGYSKDEQKRLLDQARFLESLVFEKVDFLRCRHILEIGCGVGAQSKILLSRYPQLQLTSVDLSDAQIEAAKATLSSELKEGRVHLQQGSVYELPFHEGQFDGLFICWFLEHVPDSLKALKELHRCLSAGARVHLAEVYNTPLSCFPHSVIIEEYWAKFNRLQQTLGGDPYIGIRLRRLLHDAGFQPITAQIHTICLDGVLGANAIPELKGNQFERFSALELKNQFLDYWVETLLSGLGQLFEHQIQFSFGRTHQEVEAAVRGEFTKLKNDSGSIFHFSYATAAALK